MIDKLPNPLSSFSGEKREFGDKGGEKEEQATIKLLNKYRDRAISEHPTKELEKMSAIYSGRFFSKGKGVGSDDFRNDNYMNVIKSVIDTKLSAVLDSKIQTEVKPKNMAFSDLEQIDTLDDIADVLQNCVENIRYLNKSEEMVHGVVLDYLRYSLGIVKVAWDQTKEDFVGEVENKHIDPFDFFPDPHSNSVESANYIFTRRKESLLSLKKRYQGNPKVLKKIEKMRKEPVSPLSSPPTITSENAIGIKNLENKDNVTQAFVSPDESSNNLSVIQMTEDVVIWEAYLKDDSIWLADAQDSDEEKETKKVEKLIYPNGRVIIYTNNIKLEDKPIDYPFGFPFECLQNANRKTFFSVGEIEPLILMQDRLNKSYRRSSLLMAKYVSKILLDSARSNVEPSDFNKMDILKVNSGGDAASAIGLFSNKSLEQLPYLLQMIEVLKRDIKEVARVNDTMISGARVPGTTSGAMVDKLQENPMSSIRDIQRILKSFLIGITQKNVTLIQLYYNQSRIIRYSGGKKFAVLRMGNEGEGEQGGEGSSIELWEKKFNEDTKKEQSESVQIIKNDLSLGKYEIRVTAGSEISYSRENFAKQTMELAKENFFGSFDDPNNLDLRELVMDALDFPNRRAIMDRMKAYKETREKAAQKSPTLMELMQSKIIALKDINGLIENIPDKNIKMQLYAVVGEEIGLIPEEVPEDGLPQGGDTGVPLPEEQLEGILA